MIEVSLIDREDYELELHLYLEFNIAHVVRRSNVEGALGIRRRT